jgi:hypothetical protein
MARPDRLLLRVCLAAGEVTFSWSADGKTWHREGRSFTPSKHTWVGARIGLFALAGAGAEAGSAVFRDFRIEALPEGDAQETKGTEV